jgi:hypothetical protein
MLQRSVAVALLFFLINSATTLASSKAGARTGGEKLKAAFVHLKASPTNLAAQKRYLKAFPQDYRSFLALFGAGGSLADGYQCDYIFALSTLQAHHSAEIGHLLVQLSKDAEYQADAPSCLQHVLTNYASQYTRAFAGFLHELAEKERNQLITFLADAETTPSPEFQRIIKNLKQLNESDLAKKFQQAQIDRARQPHG